MFDRFKKYTSAARRRKRIGRIGARVEEEGSLAPVRVEGRTIAHTFWGKSWCSNLERYSDYANRLPRGRTYVRSGAVMDLQIARGLVQARVIGSSIYDVNIKISDVPRTRWDELCRRCTGEINSLVELLQGRFSNTVMEHLCARETGLFPSPREIQLNCSCPDWATMCKHVAAVLYGIGARLDSRPELLFTLRGVDGQDLIAAAGAGATALPGAGTGRRLVCEDLGAMFGIEIVEPAPPPAKKKTNKAAPKRATTSPVVARKSRRKPA